MNTRMVAGAGALVAGLALVLTAAEPAFAQDAMWTGEASVDGRPAVRVMMVGSGPDGASLDVQVEGTVPGKGRGQDGAWEVRTNGEMRGEGMGGRDGKMFSHGAGMSPAINGKVVSVSGTTFTVEGKLMATSSRDSATTTYSVDASKASFNGGLNKDKSVADLKVGDHVVVFGAVTGTSVVAEQVMAGKIMKATPGLDVRANGQEKSGFIGKIGRFFRGLFGKKEQKVDIQANVNVEAEASAQ